MVVVILLCTVSGPFERSVCLPYSEVPLLSLFSFPPWLRSMLMVLHVEEAPVALEVGYIHGIAKQAPGCSATL